MNDATVGWRSAARAGAYAIPVEDLDPVDEELFRTGKFEFHFERLGLEDPVNYSSRTDGGSHWPVTQVQRHQVRRRSPRVVLCRAADRVKRLCFMITIAGYGLGPEHIEEQRRSAWFTRIGSGLDSGRTRAVLSDLGTTVISIMRLIGLERTEVIDRTWERAYASPFPTPEECIGAIEFPLDVYLQRIAPYYAEGLSGVEALVSRPAMLAEGMKDHAIPPEVALTDFKSPVARRPRGRAAERRPLLSGRRAGNARCAHPAVHPDDGQQEVAARTGHAKAYPAACGEGSQPRAHSLTRGGHKP